MTEHPFLEGTPFADLSIEELASRSLKLYYETRWIDIAIFIRLAEAWENETASWYTEWEDSPHFEPRPSIQELDKRRREMAQAEAGRLEYSAACDDVIRAVERVLASHLNGTPDVFNPCTKRVEYVEWPTEN